MTPPDPDTPDTSAHQQRAKRCGAYRPGHDPHHIPATRWLRPGELRMTGTARMVGDVIEFTPSDGEEPVLLRNHDPERVAALIGSGRAVEYAPRWGILTLRKRHSSDTPPGFRATNILSVATSELSPCGSLAPPDATPAERILADGGLLCPASTLGAAPSPEER